MSENKFQEAKQKEYSTALVCCIDSSGNDVGDFDQDDFFTDVNFNELSNMSPDKAYRKLHTSYTGPDEDGNRCIFKIRYNYKGTTHYYWEPSLIINVINALLEERKQVNQFLISALIGMYNQCIRDTEDRADQTWGQFESGTDSTGSTVSIPSVWTVPIDNPYNYRVRYTSSDGITSRDPWSTLVL